jgi:2-isopropylmalate synthase
LPEEILIMAINHPSFGELADNRIIMFDTTLRDGEQSPGFSMNLQENQGRKL